MRQLCNALGILVSHILKNFLLLTMNCPDHGTGSLSQDSPDLPHSQINRGERNAWPVFTLSYLVCFDVFSLTQS